MHEFNSSIDDQRRVAKLLVDTLDGLCSVCKRVERFADGVKCAAYNPCVCVCVCVAFVCVCVCLCVSECACVSVCYVWVWGAGCVGVGVVCGNMAYNPCVCVCVYVRAHL